MWTSFCAVSPFAEDDSDQDEEDHEGDGGPQDSGPQGPQEDVAKHPDVQGHRVGRQHRDADVVLPHAERGRKGGGIHIWRLQRVGQKADILKEVAWIVDQCKPGKLGGWEGEDKIHNMLQTSLMDAA